MLQFFLFLSLIIFLSSLGFAVMMKKTGQIPWQSFLLILLIVTAVSMWISVLPLVTEGRTVYKLLYAAFYVLESAVGDVDYALFSGALGDASLWRIYTILLHLLMPATAYGVILIYFLKAFSWFRYMLFRMNREIILFSDLTDKTRSYALKIKDQKRSGVSKSAGFFSDLKPLLIFTNTSEEEKEFFDEDTSRNMIFTDQSEIQILRQLKKRDITIMEMGEHENRNVEKSVEIIRYLDEECKKGTSEGDIRSLTEKPWVQKVKAFFQSLFSRSRVTEEDLKTISLYTVSSQPEAATILDNIMGRGSDKVKPIRQTVINEFKRIAFKLLYDAPLYEMIDEEKKTLDIMIVGFGRMGQEVLKAVSWTGCIPDIDVNVHVISLRGVENGNKLLSQCPELGEDLGHSHGFSVPKNGKQLNEKAPIYYYSMKTNEPEFDELVSSLSDCRYIVVSLGEDAVTLAAALQIFRVITRKQYQNGEAPNPPRIHVRIRNDENLQLFSSADDGSVFSYFEKFGSDDDIYTETRISDSEFEKMGRELHNNYLINNGLHEEKDAYEYLPESKKNSNLAAALHIKYKMHYIKGVDLKKIGPDETNKEEISAESRRIFDTSVPEEEKHRIARWEHIRWQAYMRTEGYVSCPYGTIKQRFDSYLEGCSRKEAYEKIRAEFSKSRIHPTIGDEEHLTKMSVLVGGPDHPEHFHSNDLNSVESIPDSVSGIYKIVRPEEN